MRVQPSRTRLASGLVVVTSQIPGQAASVYLRVAAGAVDERPSEHGVAHALEHMLFKGTPKRGLGESARVIEGLGGDLNAWTSHDELVLHADVAAGAWHTALDVLVDMLRHASLDAAELERERGVILEEIESYADDPDEQVAEAVQALLWGEHPYGRPVIGTRASVETLQIGTLRGFLERELTVDRGTLVVVADVSHDEVVAHASALLANWPAGPGRRPVPASAPLDGVRIARPTSTFDDRLVELAWPVPSPGHPDLAALEVLAAILGSAAGDRLTETLDQEPKAGFAGWSELSEGLHGSSFGVGFRPLPGHTLEALRRVLDTLDRLARATRGRWCARARETLLADLDFAEQTVGGIAEDLLYHEGQHGDAAARTAWRDAIASVTADEVTRVAATWLRRDRMVLGVHDPDTTDEELLTVVQSVSRRAASNHRRGDVVEASVGDVRVRVLTLDVPVVAARIVAPGGALLVPDRSAGLTAAWAATVHRGAGRMDGEALHDALDDLAADLHASDGLQSLALSATAPSSHAADLLRLLGELVLDPHFEEDELALVREELLETVRTRRDRPRQVVGEALAAARFPGHPWHLPGAGTVAGLRRLTGKDLGRLHVQHFAQGRPVVAVVGGLDVDEVLEGLAWLQDLPKGKPTPEAPPWPPLKPGKHVVHAGARQALVTLVGDGIAMGDPTRRGLELAEAILDGQSGRLFLSLREDRGLAYDLWVRNEERLGGGLFQVGLATDPSRADEAADALRQALLQLAEEPPADEELARARSVILGRQVLAEQRVEARAASLAYGALYDMDVDDAARRAHLEATGPQDVAREVRAVLDGGLLELRSQPR